ncbi:MAG: HPP family protein [Pseudomonadota bacterium]
MNRLDRLFTPLLAGAHWRDRLGAVLGAFVGILLTALICTRLTESREGALVLVASMGSSAVLLFAVPSSPLGQPWQVIGGNMASALSGAVAVQLFGHGALAAGTAVALGVLAMSVLRCLHPPGGGASLLPVVDAHGSAAQTFGFALFPVGFNALVLVGVAILFHRFAGHSYPHRARAAVPGGVLRHEDIDAALDEAGEAFDIGREDLRALLEAAERHARSRRQDGNRR